MKPRDTERSNVRRTKVERWLLHKLRNATNAPEFLGDHTTASIRARSRAQLLAELALEFAERNGV